MVTADFPVSRVHAIAAASCLSWCLLNVLVHMASRRLWPGYRRLSRRDALSWSNRITCATHALVLVCGQAPNLRDPTLMADPLFAVSDGHFTWGSVMYGYLVYDTAFTVVFYRSIGSPSFLVHHGLGLACACFGLYFNRGALFGMAIEVFFESTTPLLHLLGCLKIAGRSKGRLYFLAGMWLIVQFFVCRVVIASWYWLDMIRSVAALPSVPVWAAGAVAVYSALVALNMFWLGLLLRIAVRRASGARSGLGPHTDSEHNLNPPGHRSGPGGSGLLPQPSLKLDQPPASLTAMGSSVAGGAAMERISERGDQRCHDTDDATPVQGPDSCKDFKPPVDAATPHDEGARSGDQTKAATADDPTLSKPRQRAVISVTATANAEPAILGRS